MEVTVTPEWLKFSNMQLVLVQAQDFLQAYEAIVAYNRTISNQDDQQKIVHKAHIVTLSFTIELLLKSLHYSAVNDNKLIEGHDLKELFNDLPRDMQDKIRYAFKKRLPNYSLFDEMLDEHRNSFKDWRYFYEKKFGSFNYQFCENFAHSILEIARETLDDLKEIVFKQIDKGLINLPRE
jgi:hypothetical protein